MRAQWQQEMNPVLGVTGESERWDPKEFNHKPRCFSQPFSGRRTPCCRYPPLPAVIHSLPAVIHPFLLLYIPYKPFPLTLAPGATMLFARTSLAQHPTDQHVVKLQQKIR
jgi:hypothetical protein